jgi:hypothetical protein
MNYTCPTCRKVHEKAEIAQACCNAYYIECALSDIPVDAEFGCGAGQYGYGTVFTGGWELVLNSTPKGEAIQVFPLPPLLNKLVQQLADARYQQGREDAQLGIRHALGLT